MFRTSVRNFTPKRYGIYNQPTSMRGSVVFGITLFIGSISLAAGILQFNRAEAKRIKHMEDYKPLDPDAVVPKSALDADINEQKLKHVVFGGDSYIQNELARQKEKEMERFAKKNN